MGHPSSERATPPPLDGRSPERIAWSAAVTPWLMVWLRFMRCAQAGDPEASPWLTTAWLAVPVTARPPAAKLSRTLDVARRRGLTAVETAASTTPERPPAR